MPSPAIDEGAYFGAGILLVLVGLIVAASGAITVREAQGWAENPSGYEQERINCLQAFQDETGEGCPPPENPHQGGELGLLVGSVAVLAGACSIRRGWQ